MASLTGVLIGFAAGLCGQAAGLRADAVSQAPTLWALVEEGALMVLFYGASAAGTFVTLGTPDRAGQGPTGRPTTG